MSKRIGRALVTAVVMSLALVPSAVGDHSIGVTANPDREPDANGWYTSEIAFTFDGPPGYSCTPDSYDGPDSAEATVSTTCTDPTEVLPPLTDSFEFMYDATNPTVTITAPANGTVVSGGVSVVWNANENGAFSVRVGGTGCGSGTVVSSGNYSASGSVTTAVAAGDLASGSNTIRVCVSDAAENTGADTVSVTKDASAPTVTITAPANGTVVSGGVSVVWNANENGAFSVRVGGTGCGSGTVVSSGNYSASGSVTTAVAAGDLASGSNTIRVCVSDAVANTGADTISVVQDSQPPETTISVSPATPTNQTSATFEFTSNEGGTFECSLDTAAFTVCTSPASYPGPLTESGHTFRVRAVDNTGNVDATPALVTWEIDLTPGSLMRNVSAKPGDAEVVLRYAFPADTSITRVVITRSPTGTFPVVRKRSWVWRFRDRTVRNGRLYTYELRSRDAAGNLSLPVTVSARPRDPLISPRDGARLGVGSTPLFRWVGVANARRYNMQLWLRPAGRTTRCGPGVAGCAKVLSVFPSAPQYELAKRWRYKGNAWRLSSGRRYDWYVWPWYGTRYGKLLGWNWFRVR
jgi:hypothetical protein